MKQYTLGEAIDYAVKHGMTSPKIVFATDCEKALAQAYEAGVKRQAKEMYHHPDHTKEYVKKVMGE